jgi:hypothetical protein
MTAERNTLEFQLKETSLDAEKARADTAFGMTALDKLTKKYEDACHQRSVVSGRLGKLVHQYSKLERVVKDLGVMLPRHALRRNSTGVTTS